jgi:hypothetical protein
MEYFVIEQGKLSAFTESPGAETENGDSEARCPEAAIFHDYR